MAFGDFKNLLIRTAVEKILHDKAFNIAKNLTFNRNQRGFVSTAYKFFEKTFLVILVKAKLC